MSQRRQVNRKTLEMPTDINREEVQRLVANGAQLIDVMPVEEYEQAHLLGAIHLPLKKLDRQSARRLDPSRPIITYCNDFQ